MKVDGKLGAREVGRGGLVGNTAGHRGDRGGPAAGEGRLRRAVVLGVRARPLPAPTPAEHTERMTLGTGIAVAFARSPMQLAYTAHDLQAYSGGRFTLGLGSQMKPHIERRFRCRGAIPRGGCANSSWPCGRSGRRGTRAPR